MIKPKEVGLIGYPLSHSFSRDYFTNKFEKENLSGFCYLNFEIKSVNSIKNIISKHPELIGLNVTIPYKQAVLPFLSKLSVQAEKIGAVNTICIKRDSSEPILIGHNTDCIGFSKTLDEIPGFIPSGALVLGTGGASKAVVYVLEERGIPFKLVSRKAGQDILTYHDINQDLLDKHPLIINTTPLGMHPKIEEKPDIPYKFLGEKNFLIDLIYNPLQTLFLHLGAEAGARTLNGLSMLKAQAEASWELWTR